MEQEADFKVKGRSYQTDKSQTIRKMWAQIAARPSDFDLEIINALKASIITNNRDSLGYNAANYVNTSDEGKYGCYGDKLYLAIREKLIKIKTSEGKKINLLNGCSIPTLMKENPTARDDSSNGANKSCSTKDTKDMKETHESKKSNQKISNKEPSKAEVILQRSTIDKLNERLYKILGALNYESYVQPGEPILKSDILEIRAIGFIYMAWQILAKSEAFKIDGNVIFPFGVIVTLQRFIALCNGYIGYNVANPREKMAFSSMMLEDLQALEIMLIKAYDFSGVALYTKASDLILGCSLDTYLPKKARTAFLHQIRVSEALLNMDTLKAGFIMFYRTMTNSGKTSSIINMAAAAELLRKKFPTVFGELQIIATCDVHPVLTRWGQLLYHAGYPFGIASKRYMSSNPEQAKRILQKAQKEITEDRDCVDVEMRFSNSDTCKSIKDRLVIVCAPEIALKILKKAPNASGRFILLHDEPTMFAESVESTELRVNMSIMQYAPKWAIFSSATLPYDAEKVQVFIDHHRGRFPAAEFIDNTSSEIYSCCNLRGYDGEIIVPHLGIRTQVELEQAIMHINNNPFLGKLYTPLSTKELYERACTVGQDNKAFVAKVPRIMKIFANVDNLFPDKVRTVTLDILKAMLELNDEEIEEICSGEAFEYESSSEEEDTDGDDKAGDGDDTAIKVDDIKPEEDIEFVSSKPSISTTPTDINFANLGTTEAYRFPYLNLIASDTPASFMQVNYAGLLEDVKKKISSLARLQSDYQQRINGWETARDALEKKIKNEDALSKKLSEHSDIRPSLIYPDECQINTRTHTNKYAKHATISGKMNGKYRPGITLDTEMLDEFHITEDVKLGLLSGVCFYGNPETINEDEDYLATALELTSMRKVESLIADASICYGTDYPIGGVVITPEFAARHSLNTIYQLMSRAGRGRKSSNADIYVSKECAELILATVRNGSNYINQETENMIRVFEEIS